MPARRVAALVMADRAASCGDTRVRAATFRAPDDVIDYGVGFVVRPAPGLRFVLGLVGDRKHPPAVPALPPLGQLAPSPRPAEHDSMLTPTRWTHRSRYPPQTKQTKALFILLIPSIQKPK